MYIYTFSQGQRQTYCLWGQRKNYTSAENTQVYIIFCLHFFHHSQLETKKDTPPPLIDEDDVELNVLGCQADILGTNCKKLLKLKTQT